MGMAVLTGVFRGAELPLLERPAAAAGIEPAAAADAGAKPAMLECACEEPGSPLPVLIGVLALSRASCCRTCCDRLDLREEEAAAALEEQAEEPAGAAPSATTKGCREAGIAAAGASLSPGAAGKELLAEKTCSSPSW